MPTTDPIITITALPDNSGLNFTAGQYETVNDLLEFTPNIAVSIERPADGSGFNLTSMGTIPLGTFWRLRNGTNNAASATFSAYNSQAFSIPVTLAANTDTYVSSSISTLPATHILQITGPGGRKITKAASSTTTQVGIATSGQRYHVSGSTLHDTLAGAELEDTLSGNDGNDTLRGNGGDDSLLGGLGNDSLLGGDNNDTLLGHDGNDTLLGEGGDDSLDGGTGNDSLDGGTGNDSLLGNDGNDTINGAAGTDTLFGGNGNDSLLGGDNNDTLFGGNGTDSLFGGDGNDSLSGGGDSDTLTGGAGNDTLTGGSSADRFVFNSSTEGIDTITDFTLSGPNGIDAIVVSNAGFGGGLTTVGGTLDPTLFGATGGGTVRFVYSSGVLSFDTDAGAGVSLVTIANLTGSPGLTAGNIQVIA